MAVFTEFEEEINLFNRIFNFYRCTVHFEIYAVHSPTNALFINLVKSFKFTLNPQLYNNNNNNNITEIYHLYVLLLSDIKTVLSSLQNETTNVVINIIVVSS